ncbi:MAG TPA: aminotransferase class I/II-fold pyridoxal phosphate-dependent enzyme [Clostridia bacterium]|nr:aminotransferase class I/II-fold pyridoxal phosphate-dependent enzyme [Clostridia bacterium]
MDKKRKYGFNTLAVHSGSQPFHAVNPPIFLTSTFHFDSLEHAEETFSFARPDYVYTRGNNPTLRLLEEKVALLEEGTDAVAFSSGMAAISSVLLSLLEPGDTVVAHRTVYGSSYSVLSQVLPRYGIACRFLDLTKRESLAENMSERVKVIYFETPANPNLEIIDIAQVSALAQPWGAKVVVDNTFATPYFQKPLTLGADVVVHSATKYISGHGDVLGGLAVSRDLEYIHRLKFGYLCELGGVMSPFNGWLLLRGLKTLGLRMERHERNAFEVARFLLYHPKVTAVHYPGLPRFPGYETAKRQMTGFGGMLSFEVRGGLAPARKLVNSLRLIKLAVSLGDAETLVEHPASMTHRGYPRETLEQFGLTESMIRLSLGLEDPEDIIADLEQALAQV